MIYNSDRYGFNNPDHEWDEKHQDEKEIVDKHSVGSGSPDGQHEHGDIFGFADDDVVDLFLCFPCAGGVRGNRASEQKDVS